MSSSSILTHPVLVVDLLGEVVPDPDLARLWVDGEVEGGAVGAAGFRDRISSIDLKTIYIEEKSSERAMSTSLT